MRVLITYPVGLLLRAYMLSAAVLIRLKAKKESKLTISNSKSVKKPTMAKEPELQTV